MNRPKTDRSVHRPTIQVTRSEIAYYSSVALLIRRYKVSEERNQIREEQSSALVDLAAFANWEAQLQVRENDRLARRIAPLKTEIERLQTNISEISSRLAEQESVTDEQEASGLLDHIKQWFSDSIAKAEEDFKSRLEEARDEAAAAAREETEKSFQTRIEQACAEAAARARREAEIQVEDMREQLEASRKALTMAVASSQQPPPQTGDFNTFKTAVEDIDSQRTQSEILSALVRRVSQFAPRVVFFVIKSGDAVGWKASGFENGLNDETVKLLTVPSQKQTFLRDALSNFRLATSEPQLTGAGSDVLGLYSSPVPERVIAIPLVVFNKAVAVLYADSGTQSESSINTAAAESLTRIAGRTVELLLSRRGGEPARPSVTQSQLTTAPAETSYAAAVRPEGVVAGAAVQPAVQAESARVESGLRQESGREIHAEAPSRITTEVTPQIERISETPAEITSEKRGTEELSPLADSVSQVDETLRQAEAQLPEPAYIETEPGAGASESRRITREVSETVASVLSGSPQFEQPAPFQPPSPPAYAQQTAVSENTASAPTMPISDFIAPSVEERPAGSGIPTFPPPPAPPVFTPPAEAPRPAQPITTVPTPGSETEQRAHNDARRFARLLVSEIKLYNAAKVNDGRRNYDLYDRLKDEIDRSRKVYDKRVSPAVAARFDYFYDELVQTLAEGDPAKLGKNCPGPVVLA